MVRGNKSPAMMAGVDIDEDSERRRSSTLRNIWSSSEERQSWYSREVEQRVKLWYILYVEELILRRKPLPPSKHGRCLPLDLSSQESLIDDRRGHAYISNNIRSSRYTIWDFLPKQFLFQATRLSNFYFICIGIPQAIPGFSTTGNYTTILPVAFFLLLTILKEGYDDYRRHRMDKVENRTWATVLRPRQTDSKHASRTLLAHTWSRIKRLLLRVSGGKLGAEEVLVEEKIFDEDDDFHWARSRWCDLRVGDLVRVKRDDPIPADIALVYADGENGVSYIETMALDGETNLKTRQALPALYETCGTIADLRRCKAEFVLEDPNPNLYDFNGKVTIDDQTLPLTLDEVVYRGSVLRNTRYAIGLVINTGEECKIRMNAKNHANAKIPRLERYANQVVLTLIVYVIILSVGTSVGYIIWQNSTEKHSWYLNDAAVPFKQIIIGFLIMFNNVIPLALYVSLEIVKIGQMLMIQSDVEMYDEDSNTPMTCNTNTILENLGQVSYILSDKTGTLTENVMRFRGMSIAGTVWMHKTKTEEKQSIPAPLEVIASSTSIPTVKIEKVADIDVIKPVDADNIKAAYVDKSSAKLTVDEPRNSITIREHEVSPTPAIEVSTPSLAPPRPSLTRRTSKWHSSATSERTTFDLLNIIRDDPDCPTARKAREFLLGMALCHTALPEEKGGEVDFQASSPDELALIRAAQDMGILLVERSTQKITLSITHSSGNNFEETFQILELIDFSSKRKRMSIVVRCPDNRIWLICKGADSVIIPRLRQAELATRKSVEVRRSMDIERHLQRKSEQQEPRNSFSARPSLHLRGRSSMDVRVSLSRPTLEIPKHSHEVHSFDATDDSVVFRRCFQHIDDFATDGLRTLLFGHRYLEEDEYRSWKKLYNEATTSLVNRQENIEAAGELIEQGLDLSGASAIEDKLQKGVPETVDKLRRANIKIWMLTGDKRETAINIAHSARICQPSSLVYILDSTKGDLHGQMTQIVQDVDVHRVVVIDGHTLTVVDENPELKHLFYFVLIANVDSVIVCRASPSQKADIVRAIRARLPGLTLSIGDGANDIAMIQASHVGVGISGKEGLQAARVADFSIAQFRFLQRLLLVHGRYQYVRTAKFILLTFWKEMFFYMTQALYQHCNGYSGTSLYEVWSLTVLNTLFTSLCVIVPGIFEKDLHVNTLLAVPELYTFGQRNKGLNLVQNLVWIVHATVDGAIVWYVVWAGFGEKHVQGDNNLFAFGDLSFSLAILWTNWKIFIIETNYKTSVVLGACFITIGGWWVWNLFMAAAYSNNISPYDVKGGFTEGFGRELSWWLTLILALLLLAVPEIFYGAAKRKLRALRLWPTMTLSSREPEVNAEDLDVETWQEMERDPEIREKLRRMAEDDFGDENGDVDEDAM